MIMFMMRFSLTVWFGTESRWVIACCLLLIGCCLLLIVCKSIVGAQLIHFVVFPVSNAKDS